MITQERLKELVRYEDGKFIRLISVSSNARAGDVAGNVSAIGYRRVSLDGKGYYEHHLVFLYFTGRFPKEIDHINGNAADNRIENLREVPHKINSRNQKLRSTNTTGVNAVYYDPRYKKKWGTYGMNRERVRFDTMEEAIEWRKAHELEHGFHPNHGR